MSGTQRTEHCALTRLRKIAEELVRASARNDLEVARAAANLLAPTIEQCMAAAVEKAEPTADTARLALDIIGLLAQAETTLSSSLDGLGDRMKRIRAGKRSLALLKQKVPRKAAGK